MNQSAAGPSNKQLGNGDDRGLDLELIERAKTGDQRAFRELVERYQHRAYSLALALVKNEQNAREVVQEAFLRVHRGLDGFNGSAAFFTWLYRIVTNLSIDLMRRPQRRETALEEGVEVSLDHFPVVMARLEGSDPADLVRRREIVQRVQEALDELPPYHSAVIVMRELHGLSYDQMAEALNVSKGTVMSRLFHARQKLQHALASFYEEQVDAAQKQASGQPSRSDGKRPCDDPARVMKKARQA